MKKPTQTVVVRKITEQYLTSGDFNGYPVRQIPADFEINESDIIPLVISLIRRGRISVVTSHELNPHIKRFRDLAPAKQLELLKTADLTHTCAYPSNSQLRRVVNRTKYRTRPFTLELMLGEAQLAYRVFDLSVLEFYRNDPRYYYYSDDIAGSIHVHGRPGKQMRDSDKIYLSGFGFAYNKKHHRAVAVYLRDLSRLKPQHQQLWRAKLLRGDWTLHPDYYRATIIGDWPRGISIFEAILEEMRCVNDMCQLIGRPHLFKTDFRDGQRPKSFGFLIRPTLKELNDSIQLLDKMLSENINPKFFMGEVNPRSEQTRGDGTVETRQKGTIQLLEEWISIKFRTPDRKPIDAMVRTMRRIRDMRSKPAHTIKEDRFDQKYLVEQRNLMIETYEAIQTLRLMFSNHPKARTYQLPGTLTQMEIWTE